MFEPLIFLWRGMKFNMERRIIFAQFFALSRRKETSQNGLCSMKMQTEL